MPPLAHRTARHACLALMVLALLSGAAWLLPRAFTGATAAAADSVFVRRIPLTSNDIVYDGVSQRIYASVPSRRMRADVLRAVAENAEFSRRQVNRAFVLMQFFGYLRRNPNDPPDGNFDGYNFWLSKLEQFGGDFVRAEMVRAFISSDEYRQRFGQ